MNVYRICRNAAQRVYCWFPFGSTSSYGGTVSAQLSETSVMYPRIGPAHNNGHNDLACVLMHMSMPEALIAATLNAAAALGLAETHGTIEAGKYGDMVVIDANR